jgi:hypothetical protein
MRQRNVTAYVLVGLLAVGAISVGYLLQMSYAAAGVLMAVVVIMVLIIHQRSTVDEQASVAMPGAENAVLIVMTFGVFRILEGAALQGASWLALGCLLAVVGLKFLSHHWSR